MKKVLIIVGTRPNFIKVTQFQRVAKEYPNIEVKIAHTGQHYDNNMSKVFFEQFKLLPDFFLNVPASRVAKQVGEIIIAIDSICEEYEPDLLICVGDVNSTLCASIVANKRHLKLAHLESGLRSRDREMPEEINRILTDEITDHYFVTEQSGIDNLLAENKSENQIHFVGNTMIDTLVAFKEDIEKSTILEDNQITPDAYYLITMHRPSNVDNKEGLVKVIELLKGLSTQHKVVFPVHPRTIKRLEQFDLLEEFKAIEQLIILEPLDYFAFQKLIANARCVITDSGGIQEETTFLEVRCITIRENTERPSTLDLGTNTLMSFDPNAIIHELENKPKKNNSIPPLWDGRATERILAIIDNIL